LRTVVYKEASQQRAPTVSDMTPYRPQRIEEKFAPLLEAKHVSVSCSLSFSLFFPISQCPFHPGPTLHRAQVQLGVEQ